MHASPMQEYIVEFANRAAQEWGTLMGCDPCLSMSREALAWLENLDTTDTTDHGDCAVTLKAVEDLHDSQALHASLTSQDTLELCDAGD